MTRSFLRSSVPPSVGRHDVFKARSKSSFTLRPYQGLRFARPRRRADLRGHHDDLHGSNAVSKACHAAFQPGRFLRSPRPFGIDKGEAESGNRTDSESALTTRVLMRFPSLAFLAGNSRSSRTSIHTDDYDSFLTIPRLIHRDESSVIKIVSLRGLRPECGNTSHLIAALTFEHSFRGWGHSFISRREGKEFDEERQTLRFRGSVRARAKITVGKIVNGEERRRMKRHNASRSRARLFPVTAFLTIIEGSCCVSAGRKETA